MAKKISELKAEEVLKLSNLMGKSDKALEKIIGAYPTEIKGHFESVSDFRKFIQRYPKWHKDNTKFLEVLKLRLQANKQSNAKKNDPSSTHMEDLSIERAIGYIDYLLKDLKEHRYDRFKEGLSTLLNELKLLFRGGGDGENYTGEYEREEPSISQELLGWEPQTSFDEALIKEKETLGYNIRITKQRIQLKIGAKEDYSFLEKEITRMEEEIRNINRKLGLHQDDGIIISGSAEVSMTSPHRDEETIYREAVALARRRRSTSASWLQRDLNIGYNQAAKIISRMEREGIIGPAEGSSPRMVLIPPE